MPSVSSQKITIALAATVGMGGAHQHTWFMSVPSEVVAGILPDSGIAHGLDVEPIGDLDNITPPNAILRALAAKNPPPASWFNDDQAYPL